MQNVLIKGDYNDEEMMEGISQSMLKLKESLDPVNNNNNSNNMAGQGNISSQKKQ